MPNSLIEERDERTKKRKKIKKKMDSIIGLSYHDKEHNVMSLSVEGTLTGETARLLDEGYCDNGFVLKKGTLSKYLNGQNESVRGWVMGDNGWERTDVLNLSDDFVGTVNLGHIDFSSFPFILGEWTKEDMSLVDIENERQALDIDVRLDEESTFVKEIRRQNHKIGVSAEFWYHVNQEDTTELSNMIGYYMPVIDEIFIFAYGLVGECGNVNSSEMDLKGGAIMPPNEEQLKDMQEQIDEATEVLSEVLDMENEVELSDTTNEEIEEPIENSAESEEDGSEEAEIEEADDEEVGDEEESDEAEESEEEEDADGLEEVLSIVTELRGQVATLTAQVESLTTANEELKKTNRRLQGKLKAEKDKKEKFLANAKGISVALLPEEDTEPQKNDSNEAVTKRKYIYGDGIGEE